MNTIYDCSCSGGIIYGVIQCRSCSCNCDASGVCTSANLTDITQKRIWNTVRVPASEYTMNMASLNTYQKSTSTYYNITIKKMMRS